MRYSISCAFASCLALATLPAQAEVPRVVTDMPPVASLVAQVMGDLGTPVLLLDKGADVHSFQLRPSQAAELAKADAIIWIGPEMTPWLDRAVLGLNGTAVDLRLLSVPGTVLQPSGDGNEGALQERAGVDEAGHDEAGHAGAGHEDAAHDEAGHGGNAHDSSAHGHAAHGDAAHDHAAHDHGAADPHAWLDPGNAGLWLAEIARVLTGLDPGNAAIYAANAEAAQTAVATLDAELRAMLAPAQGMPLVVYHDAYRAFSAHYGLTVLGAISSSDAATPGAAHLRDLQAAIADKTVCVFPEANHDTGLLDTLTGAHGVRVGATLDPEGMGLPDGPALYADLMRAMAQAIADCARG